MQQPQTLNITVGTDVILNVTLMHEEELLIPALIDNLEVNLITGLGKRTALTTSLGVDYIIINIPWVDGRSPGCYSIEIKGFINGLAWSSIGKGLIHYTPATQVGRNTVTVEGDTYDVTMEAGFMYSDTPIARVNATIDNEVGTPRVNVTYANKEIGLAFHNLKGEQGKQGNQGIQGVPGESAVFDPSTGNISVIVQSSGNNANSPMSQKAVTNEGAAIGKATGEYEEFMVSRLPLHNCCLGDTTWSMNTASGSAKNAQRHIVIPVSAADKVVLRCVSAGEGTGAHYAWLTSAYDSSTPTNGAALPLATGESGRITVLISDGDVLITAPADAAYLCLTIVTYSGYSVTWEVHTHQQVENLSKQTRYNTDDLDEMAVWVDHGYDVDLANGYIDTSSYVWKVNDGLNGRVIPFSQYAGKRVRISGKNGLTPRFAFLSAKPTYVNNSAVSYCSGWGLALGEYDGFVPQDCQYVYVYSYSSASTPQDRTPYVNTRKLSVLDNNGDVFTPSQEIDISSIAEQLCSIGASSFYMKTSSGVGRNAQRHIAVPVTPGDTIRAKSVDGVGQYIVVTSAYDSISTFENGVAIPSATGWETRRIGKEVIFTVPSNGAYLLMTSVDGSGISVTYTVETGAVSSVPSKELPSDVPTRLKVVQWNIGGFSKGASSDSNYDQHPEEYAADLPVWKGTINDMDADILCCCEYNIVMKAGHDGEPDVIARDEIFSPFRHAYIQPKLSGYNMKAIFSHAAAEEVTRTLYTNSVSGYQYYQTNKYRINNRDVYVIATHLDWNNGEHGATYRQEQMEELMAFAADKEYVIICGDFNVGAGEDEAARIAGPQEVDQWLEEGYKMANHGYLGDFNTGHMTYSVLDNIIVKGFDISEIKIYDGDNASDVPSEQTHQLSDHAAIGCVLTMLE